MQPCFSISSYTWQSQWGPDYHPSMYIGIACLSFSTILALGKFDSQCVDIINDVNDSHTLHVDSTEQATET